MNAYNMRLAAKFLSTVALLAAALALSACGSSKKSSIATPPPPPTPVTVVSVTTTATTANYVTATSAAKGVGISFRASALLSNNTNQDVTSTATWSSDDDTILAFETAGLPNHATAKKVGGPVTITAADASGTSGTVAYSVTAAAPEKLAISPTTVPNGVPVGQNGNFSAIYTLTDKTTADATADVDWSSSSGQVVLIGNDAGNKGKAVAQTVGTSNISAAKGSLKSQDVAVKVFQPDAQPQFVIEPSAPAQLPLGRTQQFKALLKYSGDQIVDVTKDVTWQSSAVAVANFPVDPDFPPGLLLASPTTAGAVTITALDPKTATVSAPVAMTVSNVAIQSVTVTPAGTAGSALQVGANRQLGAVLTYADSVPRESTQTLAWTTAGLGYLTVTNSFGSKGLVKSNVETPVGMPKDAVIITDLISSQATNVEIDTVGRILERIEIAPGAPQNLPIGHTLKFQATAIFNDGTTGPATDQVTWESSNQQNVSISNAATTEKGNASALKLGSAVINATYVADGTKIVSDNRITVTATAATLDTITVGPATAVTLALGRSQQLSATGNFSDGSKRDITGLVNWISGTPATVSISNSGATKGSVRGEAIGGPISVRAVEPQSNVFTTKPILVSGKAFDGIAITPGAPVSSAVGIPYLDYVAIASYSDGSGDPITEQVQWESSNPAVASVSNEDGKRGHVLPKTVGTTSITASAETFTSPPATFNVTGATLQSIALTPPGPHGIAVDATVKLAATGTYSDSSTQDISGSVLFESSDRSKVTISNTSPNNGLLVGVGPGLADILAKKDGVTSTVVQVVVSTGVVVRTVLEVVSDCCDGETVTMEGTIVEILFANNYRLQDASAAAPIVWTGNAIPLNTSVRIKALVDGSTITVTNVILL